MDVSGVFVSVAFAASINNVDVCCLIDPRDCRLTPFTTTSFRVLASSFNSCKSSSNIFIREGAVTPTIGMNPDEAVAVAGVRGGVKPAAGDVIVRGVGARITSEAEAGVVARGGRDGVVETGN